MYRKLTRILREKGLAGCIMAGAQLDEIKALEQAKAFPGLKGMDLAKEVTVSEAYEWTEGSWKLGQGHTKPAAYPFHVVAYDLVPSVIFCGCWSIAVPSDGGACQDLGGRGTGHGS